MVSLREVLRLGTTYKSHGIHRLEHDILLTHSAPAIMRTFPDDPRDTSMYLVPGELVIWRWFGIDRFFPPNQEEVSPNILHGCSSVGGIFDG